MSDNTGEHETDRLTFSVGIVASWLAYLAVRKDYFQKWLPPEFERYLILAISASAIFSFLYLLATASMLKYNNKSYAGYFQLGGRSRSTLYDLSVDILGIAPIYFVSTWFLIWFHNHFYRKPLVLGLGFFIYTALSILLFQAAWIFIMFLLSQLYNENSKLTPKLIKEAGWLIWSLYVTYEFWGFSKQVHSHFWHVAFLILSYFSFLLSILVFSPLHKLYLKLGELELWPFRKIVKLAATLYRFAGK